MRRIRLQHSGSDRLREALARELNESQRAAATAPDGFNLILAGPGSGKTRVITYRVAYLMARGVPPESILLVTFTRRAAREMVGRLEALAGPDAAKVWAGTFHHIGNRVLRRSAERLGFAPSFTLLDGEDQSDLMEPALADAGVSGTGKFAPKSAVVLNLLSYSFNVQRPFAEVVAERHPDWSDLLEPLQRAVDRYAERKRAANCMDYDDLLGLWAKLIREHPDERARQAAHWRHILVDEMQDTNLVQAELVETLAKEGAGNLTAVGDDAQSIYRFRGADYDNILRFPERNPGTNIFRLDVNYRSTPEIVAFTNASIAHNRSGFPKSLVSARDRGVKPALVPTADAYEEASLICHQILESRDRGVPLGHMAVLYRNHHDSILLQAELVQRGIPYTVRSGLRFFEQAHIKDVLAHLRILVNPRDETAWRRLLLMLPGIGAVKASVFVERLVASAEPLAFMTTADAMALLPPKAKGPYAAFVTDIGKIRATSPGTNPAGAVGAVLQGGYPAVVRAKYERPDNRIADIEQLAVLAARYDSLDKLIADLLLAGDVYGMESVAAEDSEDTLVLSTVHQAKGLEWSIVFVPRLVEDGFPNGRALNEAGGEEEERRIFYVAITRAKDELYLVYPLTSTRPGKPITTITEPSRFLTEVDPALIEQVVVETDIDLAWSSGLGADEPPRP